ncbi:AfsA-related hotdog domain-containing protein [Streptomyces sp. NPDC047002]|uniref:AfsA-related hotdog domain-containing protein n=1 Tax=Streptomyces sp. NPDC047002 TaxID=3155475 RepID=UPI003453F9C2
MRPQSTSEAAVPAELADPLEPGGPPDPRDVVFIVGDNLASRSPAAGLMSLTALLTGLDNGSVRAPWPVLVPGQGIERYEREIVRGRLRRLGIPESILRDPPMPPMLGCAEVHKHNPDNVLLAGLDRVADDRFSAALRISDRQEMVLDHAASAHVTAAVITEVVRQMSLAVAERYLLARTGTPRRFILNSLESSFSRFLLPLPTRIDYRLEEHVWKGQDRLRFRGRCDLVQAGASAATGSMDMVVMAESRAALIEERQFLEAMPRLAYLGDAAGAPLGDGAFVHH